MSDPPSTGTEAAAGAETLSPPLDLTHHYSGMTKKRQTPGMWKIYKYLLTPGLADVAQGNPSSNFFPFDTLEAQIALPDRWVPTPNGPPSATDDLPPPTVPFSVPPPSPSSSSSPLSSTQPTAHLSVPKVSIPGTVPSNAIDLRSAFQYGPVNGYLPLLSFVRQFVREHLHPAVPYAGGPDIALTCGSTDGFSKVLELLVDPWIEESDPITARENLLIEPCAYFIAKLQAASRGLGFAPVETDEGGMQAHGRGGLEDVLANWDTRNGKRPRIMYAVTMGHNPTGILMSLERRREIYAVCSKYDVIIVEDEPYWHLQYPSADTEEAASRNLEPPPPAAAHSLPAKSSGYDFIDSLVPSFLAIDTDGRVIRLDTFSKMMAPGARLGWVTAQPAFIERIVRITETNTKQASGFSASVIAALIMGAQPAAATSLFSRIPLSRRSSFAGWQVDGFVRWLAGLRGGYERRMSRMCRIIDAHSQQLKQGTPVNRELADWSVVTRTRLLSFSWPRAGMYVWIRIHFEDHPLWMLKGKRSVPVMDGPLLGLALIIYLVKKPWLVGVNPGRTFAVDDTVERETAWKYVRLSFAGIQEDDIDQVTLRFVHGLHRFWRIKDTNEIEDLIDDYNSSDAKELSDGIPNLSTLSGC